MHAAAACSPTTLAPTPPCLIPKDAKDIIHWTDNSVAKMVSGQLRMISHMVDSNAWIFDGGVTLAEHASISTDPQWRRKVVAAWPCVRMPATRRVLRFTQALARNLVADCHCTDWGSKGFEIARCVLEDAIYQVG